MTHYWSPTQQDILRVFNITEEDLETFRQGTFKSTHRKIFEQILEQILEPQYEPVKRAIPSIRFSMGFYTLLLTLFLAASITKQSVVLFIFSTASFILMLWLYYSNLQLVTNHLATQTDEFEEHLLAKELLSIRGTVSFDQEFHYLDDMIRSRNRSRIRYTKYFLKINGERFLIPRDVQPSFASGGEYTLYYLPNKIVVAAEQHYPTDETERPLMEKFADKAQRRLDKALDVREDDLAYNQQGKLSPHQLEALPHMHDAIILPELDSRTEGTWLFGILLAASIIVPSSISIVHTGAITFEWNLMPYYVIFSLGLGATGWYLVIDQIKEIKNLRQQLQEDLQIGKVIKTHGRVVYRHERYLATSRKYLRSNSMRYYIKVNDLYLQVTKEAQQAFIYNYDYTVYYLPETKLVVSAEQHMPLEDHA